jgi:hypothetical protein
MERSTERSIVLVGDLDDGLVENIARALEPHAQNVHVERAWPDPWPRIVRTARIAALVRGSLGLTEVDQLRALREGDPSPSRVVLIHGPHVRYHLLERARMWVDHLVPEASAVESLLRVANLAKAPANPSRKGRLGVACRESALRELILDALRSLTSVPLATRDAESLPPVDLLVWVVPTLEPDWPLRLRRLADRTPVVAVIPFADREAVDLALKAKASACLDLNGGLEAIATVVARLIQDPARDGHLGHALPPPPHASVSRAEVLRSRSRD